MLCGEPEAEKECYGHNHSQKPDAREVNVVDLKLEDESQDIAIKDIYLDSLLRKSLKVANKQDQ